MARLDKRIDERKAVLAGGSDAAKNR